ncbi:MAG: SH3 domain-containing protein [Desulfobacterales bacterium]
MVILIIAGLSTGAKYYLHNHSKIGVVLDPSLDIKSATNMDNVTLFKLNEGAVVSIKKETKDWVQIELADGKKGWAPKEFIGY